MKEELLEGFFNRRDIRETEKDIKKEYKKPYLDHSKLRDMQSHNKHLHNIEYEERTTKVDKLEKKLSKLQHKKDIFSILRRYNTYDNIERNLKKANEHKHKMMQADHFINYHHEKSLQQDKARIFSSELERKRDSDN